MIPEVLLFILLTLFNANPLLAKNASWPPWHLDRLDQHHGLDSEPFHGQVVARARPVLYVIDSGVNREHEEFTAGSSRVVYGYNFVDETWESGDCMGHGTHVAGLAAGSKYGVAGSIGVDIVSVRILDCLGRGSCSSMIRGLEWVHRNHSAMRAGVPGVVVMSIGSRQSECQGVDIVADALSERNIIVVAAAGNSGANSCMFHPASSKNAITVGAVELKNNQDTAWNKTNFGQCVDIYAPGVAIMSAWSGSAFNNGTKVLSGTSMAAPMVAGQALLIVAAVPTITVENTRRIIEESASRGTILGSQVDPNAHGSRVARVPWLSVDADYIAQIPHGHKFVSSAGMLQDHDTATFVVKTSSQTNPAIQFAVDRIAKTLYRAVTRGVADGESLNLLVRCADATPPSARRYAALRKALSKSRRTRGWDVRQEAEEAGVFTLNILCNISGDAHRGKALKNSVSEALASGKIQDLFGRNVTLLSEPILTSVRVSPGQDGMLLRKILMIVIPTILGLVVTAALVAFCRLRKLSR